MSASGFREVGEIPVHVMHVPVGEGRGLERGVDVDKLASFLPGAQGDSALGVLCGIHNGVQFEFRGLRHGGIGHALLKVHQTFLASILDL